MILKGEDSKKVMFTRAMIKTAYFDEYECIGPIEMYKDASRSEIIDPKMPLVAFALSPKQIRGILLTHATDDSSPDFLFPYNDSKLRIRYSES